MFFCIEARFVGLCIVMVATGMKYFPHDLDNGFRGDKRGIDDQMVKPGVVYVGPGMLFDPLALFVFRLLYLRERALFR